MKTVVSQFGVGALQQKLTIGDLHLLSDAYVSNGGAETGPTPHEFLGAALAACTSMTLKMYAGRKSLNLDNAIVKVDIERANDVEIFTRTIQLEGKLSSEEKERLIEIANKCPIHKALSGDIQIKTQLVN
ncbi:OsmC family protein [Polynucleobacter sp. UK-Kesae-W10]|uniref:OsmC family protein n=1 Tax=Polynucleobacter sp. UK-Kesae-W10 TaxID=1819738 RepID=UPI001C0B58D0|nr:OsmC family protein [Polynucleobacter sp. UK-Kesae-W10]MBU3576395.1 OsmC family protein [Polynucleobacter sp. UK-Kesae-W10]